MVVDSIAASSDDRTGRNAAISACEIRDAWSAYTRLAEGASSMAYRDMAVILAAGVTRDGRRPRRRSAGAAGRQPGALRPRLLPHLEGLDHVTDLRGAEAGQCQTTLEALADLGG